MGEWGLIGKSGELGWEGAGVRNEGQFVLGRQ